MTEAEQKALMERHGITTSQQAVYYCQGFRYSSFADALNYAERTASRVHEPDSGRKL